MFETFRNAWKIEDLRRRILYTLLIIVIFRFGIAVPVPFIEPGAMRDLINQNAGDMLSFVDFMTGGAFSSASLFALGVQPYINASIIMTLLAVAIPYLDRLRKEGPEGQKKFNKISRIAGAGLGAVMGIGYYFMVRNSFGLEYGPGSPVWAQIFTAVVIVAAFVAGSMFLMWMGEQIDQKGIGNGISILIFAGIISRWSGLGKTVTGYLDMAKEKPSIYIWIPLIALLAIGAVILVVILNAAERRIPVQYAKKVVGRKMYGGQATHIPIKVNMSGVMPIIFASALTSLPSTLLRLIPNLNNATEHPFWASVLGAFSTSGWLYAVIYAILIIAFNYFYVAITYNPLEIANNLKKNNGAIPGIRPGKPTSDYISRVISKVILIGAIFLVLIAVGPIVLANISGVSIQLGGTSLLIVVGVALDTSRSLESFMLMRHHKGFLE